MYIFHAFTLIYTLVSHARVTVSFSLRRIIGIFYFLTHVLKARSFNHCQNTLACYKFVFNNHNVCLSVTLRNEYTIRFLIDLLT